MILLTNPDTQKVKVGGSVLSNLLGYSWVEISGNWSELPFPLPGIFLTRIEPSLSCIASRFWVTRKPYPDTQVSRRLTQSTALCTWANRTWRHLDEPQEEVWALRQEILLVWFIVGGISRVWPRAQGQKSFCLFFFFFLQKNHCIKNQFEALAPNGCPSLPRAERSVKLRLG